MVRTMLRASCCCCWKASKHDEETERVEAPTQPTQGSGNIGNPACHTFPGRLGRAYAKLVKRGQPKPEQLYARASTSPPSSADADETASQNSAAEATSAASDSISIEAREVSAPSQALAAIRAELAGIDVQLAQAGFSRQNLPQDLAAVHSRQQEAAQRSEELQRFLDDARQQVIQTRRSDSAAQEQLSAQQASRESLVESLREAEATVIGLQKQLTSSADLQAVVRGLEQALAEQKITTEEAQARAQHAQQQVQEAHTLSYQLRKASEADVNALTSLKSALQRDDEEKAAMTEEAKVERHSREAHIYRVRAELLQQEQAHLQAASRFEQQLTVLQEQLQEQQKRVAVKDKQLKKVIAAKDEQLQKQLQEAASSKADLMQKFGHERTEKQALLDEQLLEVAELQAANTELDRAHTSTLQRFASERSALQASWDEQKLRVAQLEAANAELDRAHTSTLQAELQRAEKEKAVMADKAKADTHTQQASIVSLKGELANLKQVVQEQQRNLQAASLFEPQLSVLQKQLEEAASSKADMTKRFATERRDMQACLDDQRLKVAELEAANTGVDSTHRETVKAMADFKQKRKEKAMAMRDSFNRALQSKQQEMDSGLSEKDVALAAAKQALEDTQAASKLALQDFNIDRGLMEVSLNAHKQKVADLETAARECSITHHHALQVQTQAAQNEVAAAQLARHETANIQRKLKAASERNAAQQSKLAQLQAEVERLQAEVQQLQQQLQGVQATGAGELRPLSNRHLGPLGFTSHEQQAHPQTSVLSLPQPPPPRPHPLVFGQPSAIQAVSRTDSLGSVASSASLGPRTPFGRQNASNPYQPHLQPAQVQVVSQTAEGRGTTLYYTGDHVKALVGEVVKVDSSTGDDTHKIFSRVCLSNGWRFYLDVRGDGNCGYRAVAVGLVVAIAGLSANSRRSFVQHLQQLYSSMQQEEGLLQFSSASGGNAHQGFSALQRAFETESEAADRLRMDGRSVVPSTELLNLLNDAHRSDSAVLFLRAVSAFHMLTHPQEFKMTLMVQYEENEEERQWPLHRICHECILPFCEGMQSAKADKRQADASNTIRAIAEALKLVIKVGTNTHVQPYGTDSAQRSRAAWSRCELGVVSKPGHFGIAWA